MNGQGNLRAAAIAEIPSVLPMMTAIARTCRARDINLKQVN
jgi:hypothetical protein